MAAAEDKFLEVEKSQSETVKIRYSVFSGGTGRSIFVIAGVHGHELNGIEVVRRLRMYLATKKLSGKVTLIPVANPLAFDLRQRNADLDGMDLNRCFSQGEPYTFTAKLADAIFKNIVSGHDFGIDLHTGPEGRLLLPHTRIRSGEMEDRVKALSRVFGTLIAMSPEGDEAMLSTFATSKGIPTLSVELGEARRIDEYFVRAGFFGVVNVLRYLGIIEGRANVLENQLILNERHNVCAGCSGLFFPKVKLGQMVDEGQVLAEIYDVGKDATVKISAERKGIVLALFSESMVAPETTIFSILTLDDCALNDVPLEKGRYSVQHVRDPTDIWKSVEY